MTEFINIKNVYTPERKLNEIEMLRAIKFAIASEYEAIQIYQQIMESTDNINIKRVLAEIMTDEKHHVGGLNKLLEILSPTDAQEYAYGAQETLDNISE